MFKAGKKIVRYGIAIGLVIFCSCKGGIKNKPGKLKATSAATATGTKADTLVYWLPGILPDLYGAKAEKWAAEKYGFTIYRPGCEVNDSIVYATKKNNEKLFAWLNKRYHIPDEQSLQNMMLQYVRASKDIHSVIGGYLKEIKIGSRKNHYADLSFNFTDSTQKEFMVSVYDIDGVTGKRTSPAVILRVNTLTKGFLAHPDL